jgi:hypothetical protein
MKQGTELWRLGFYVLMTQRTWRRSFEEFDELEIAEGIFGCRL